MSTDLSNTPAGVPPAGVIPDLHGNPPSLQSYIIGFCALFYALTTIFVSLRFYSVFRGAQKIGADDVLCVLAVICTFAYMAFLIHLSYAARHMWDVPLSWLYSDPQYWKLRLAQNLFNPLAFFFSRAPIFMLYLRLFNGPHQRKFGLACWAGVVAAFLIYVHTFILVAVVCSPKSGHSFIDTDTFNRCSMALPDAIVQGAGNILLDIYALLLPQPIIWKLKLSPRKKLSIALVFSVGLIALCASAISMYYRTMLKVGSDTDWNEGAYDVTSTVELNITIICSCAPGIWRLIREKSTGQRDRPFYPLTDSVIKMLGLSRSSRRTDSGKGSYAYDSQALRGQENPGNSGNFETPYASSEIPRSHV